MAWVRQVSEAEAEGALKSIYSAARSRAGRIWNILRVMSLKPKQLGVFMKFYADLMLGDAILSRADREMLATVTSEANGCFY